MFGRLSSLVPSPPSVPAAGSSSGIITSSYEAQANRVLAAFSDRLAELSLALPRMCCGAHLMLKQPMRQVIVAGAQGQPETQALLDAVHAAFVPDKAVVVLDPEDQDGSMRFFEEHNPEAVAMVRRHFSSHQGVMGTRNSVRVGSG